MGECKNKNCFADLGESCCKGEINHSECSNWIESSESVNADNYTHLSHDGTRVPWSSGPLGNVDLTRFYQQSHSILIGLLGAENSGKTTFLAANYLLFLSGMPLSGWSFCGSQSLGAWEAIAANLRLTNEQPSFPAHTPRGTERTPGILHFALKNQQNVVNNIFFTDSPGEWFTSWSVDANAIDAKGAHWTAKYSDAFFIFADCEKLAGEKRGSARKELRAIIERLGETVGSRPVMLVWAKNDKPPIEGIKLAIQKALKDNIPHAQEIEISVNNPELMNQAVGKMLAIIPLSSTISRIREPVLSFCPFLSYRGHHEYT